MQSPPTPPPAQWLASSIAWTAGCLGSWLLLYYALPPLWQSRTGPAEWLCLGGFWLAHFLIWRKAVAGGSFLLWTPAATATALDAVSSTWLACLFVFQLLAFVLGIAVSGLTLVLVNWPA
ncbi:MAG: hypothetical protein ACRYFX_16430 [Janthinobacterium lividum]